MSCPSPYRARKQEPTKNAVGPVLPLNATGTEKAVSFWAPRSSQQNGKPEPFGARVLNRGEATVAPRGRADDFLLAAFEYQRRW